MDDRREPNGLVLQADSIIVDEKNRNQVQYILSKNISPQVKIHFENLLATAAKASNQQIRVMRKVVISEDEVMTQVLSFSHEIL